jgi:uncharacterized membrane protein YecN with MAPEG domain
MNHLMPISTLVIGLNGLTALALSAIVVTERTTTRIWHGESQAAVTTQPDYLQQPNRWAAYVEQWSQKNIADKPDDGMLLRKVRAHANFTEYVPLALLLIAALELMQAAAGLVWLLGATLTIARLFHAWGVIATYGPSPQRAIGFFGTWFVYIVGSFACLSYGWQGIQ